MKRLLCTAALLAVMSLTSGCMIYFGDDTGDDCYYEDQPDDYWLGYRNPETGVCEDWGGGGGGGCYDDYDDYGGAEADPIPLPDWASCPGACEGLDELTCLATEGCRGAYYQEDCPPGSDCDAFFEIYFMECWGTAPTGPIYGACEGLDAYSCSLHSDCIAVYTENWDTGGQLFSYCAPEPGTTGCEAVDCGPGYTCEIQCYPDGTCWPTCVAIGECGDSTMCPPGTHCETWCTGGGDCWPGEDCPPKGCWSECVPDDPGPITCDGPVFCDSLPPGCPPNSVPGIQNGCWSGTCIPVEECDDPPPPPSCESLGTEEECIARPDCVPAYDGFGCTCYPDGTCSCAEWVYNHCETGGGGGIDPDPMPL